MHVYTYIYIYTYIRHDLATQWAQLPVLRGSDKGRHKHVLSQADLSGDDHVSCLVAFLFCPG